MIDGIIYGSLIKRNSEKKDSKFETVRKATFPIQKTIIVLLSRHNGLLSYNENFAVQFWQRV